MRYNINKYYFPLIYGFFSKLLSKIFTFRFSLFFFTISLILKLSLKHLLEDCYQNQSCLYRSSACYSDDYIIYSFQLTVFKTKTFLLVSCLNHFTFSFNLNISAFLLSTRFRSIWLCLCVGYFSRIIFGKSNFYTLINIKIF